MPGKLSVGSAKHPNIKKEAEVESTAKKIHIWPEWSESEIAAEKFDPGGKGKDKPKSTVPTGALFEDQEGQPILPPSLSGQLASWKRPSEYFVQEVPVVVTESDHVDLVSANEHLFSNKLMASIIAELKSLIYLRQYLPQLSLEPDQSPLCWQPWHHICPWPKGSAVPVYNPLGKYCVRLYWMGCWRKVTVDDQIPMDDNDHILLPITSVRGELWPIILTKALLKIINLESTGKEYDSLEYSVTELLTGWVCESIQSKGMTETWNNLSSELPKWIRPGEEDGSIPVLKRDSILLASFTPDSSEVLKRCGLSFTDPTHPILITQWKDEPLELPPKEPPLPSLEVPYYLGLKDRKHRPGTTPPPPVKTDHRSFELFSPFFNTVDNSFISWIDLDDFTTVFKEIRFYRKQESFSHCHTSSDLSLTTPNSAIPPAAGVKKGVSNTQLASNKAPIFNILFIDSSQPVSLLIGFSSINCWYEGNVLVGGIQPPSLGFSVGEDQQKIESVIQLGSLQVEPYSWKRFNGGIEPLMSLRTAGTRAVTLELTEGRHILKLQMTGTFGYHVAVFSQTKFSLTDEDGILSLLNTASEKFLIHCKQVFESLLTMAGQQPDQYQQSFTDLSLSHSSTHGVRRGHVHSLRAALLHTLHVLGPHHGLTTGQVFAWKSFINQLMVKLAGDMLEEEGEVLPMKFEEMKKLKFGAEGLTITDEDLKQLEQDITVDQLDEEKESDSVSMTTSVMSRHSELPRMAAIDESRELEEQDTTAVATAAIGTTVSKGSVISTASASKRSAETAEKGEREGQIMSSIPLLQSHIGSLGTGLSNSLFAIRPDLLALFPFGTNEHTRAYHKQLAIGSVPALEPNRWTVMFRDTFHVPIAQDVSVRLHGPLKKYLIKIVNNDTKEEQVCGLPFSLSCPVVPNKLGYTLLGEMWSLKDPIEAVEKLTLTLISSSPHLPTLANEDDKLSTDFNTNTIRNYYLPDRHLTMLRYVVTTTAVCQVTIQLETSKPDVLFKLTVLDRGVVIVSCEGCGHCVLPSLNILPSQETTEDENTPTDEHHYIIHVSVLHDTWPVSESSWQYISMIRAMEKEDKPSSGKRGKGKEKGSKTPKPQQTSPAVQLTDGIDTTKPHWILRVVTDTDNAQCVKVVKDTEREDTMNGMIKAWDTQEPGRSQKAQQSRQKFLETHALQQKDETAPDEEIASDTAVSTSTTTTAAGSIPSFAPVMLKPIDISAFITEGTVETAPQLMDEVYIEECETAQRESIESFRQWRAGVKEMREADSIRRDNLKKAQLRKARKIQMVLNSTRERLNKPREELRNTFLEAERIKQEALMAEKTKEDLTVSSGRDSKKGRKSPKGKKK